MTNRARTSPIAIPEAYLRDHVINELCNRKRYPHYAHETDGSTIASRHGQLLKNIRLTDDEIDFLLKCLGGEKQ